MSKLRKKKNPWQLGIVERATTSYDGKSRKKTNEEEVEEEEEGRR